MSRAVRRPEPGRTKPLLFSAGGWSEERSVGEVIGHDPGFDLDRLLPALVPDPATASEANGGGWEIEIGFGKGRYLLSRALAEPERRFLGVEIATEYYRILSGRARRQGVENLLTVRGDALYLISAFLPKGIADTLHVYFPDPWPKAKHRKRRLFDRETVDLVLGLLRPKGRLFFATDFLDYGELVADLLESHPAVEVRRREEQWPDGARTNYEAKYIEEDRPIIRLEVALSGQLPAESPHPDGVTCLTCAFDRGDHDSDDSGHS